MNIIGRLKTKEIFVGKEKVKSVSYNVIAVEKIKNHKIYITDKMYKTNRPLIITESLVASYKEVV